MKVKTQKTKTSLADMAMYEDDKSVRIDNESKLITAGSKANLIASLLLLCLRAGAMLTKLMPSIDCKRLSTIP